MITKLVCFLIAYLRYSKQRWDWLVLGWMTAMGHKERNENFSIPSLLSCGVALKSAIQTVVLGGVSRSERGNKANEMQMS